MNRDISPTQYDLERKRTRCVEIHEADPSKSMRQIAREAGCSRKVPAKWIPHWRKHHTVTSIASKPGPREGTHTKESTARAPDGVKLMHGRERLSSRKAATTVGTSRSTVQREARRQNLVYDLVPRRPALTDAHKAARLRFARDNRDTYHGRAWARVFYTDIKVFYMRPSYRSSSRRRYWHFLGYEEPEEYVAHAPKVHVYAGVCRHGKSESLLFVTGTSGKGKYTDAQNKAHSGVCGEEYRKHILPQLIAHGNACFRAHDKKPWVFMHDNASAHQSADAVFTAHQQAYITDWPAKSPDLNIIENVWGMMATHLAPKVFESVDEFKQEVRNAWASITLEVLHTLSQSVRERTRAVIRKGGDITEY